MESWPQLLCHCQSFTNDSGQDEVLTMDNRPRSPETTAVFQISIPENQ